MSSKQKAPKTRPDGWYTALIREHNWPPMWRSRIDWQAPTQVYATRRPSVALSIRESAHGKATWMSREK